MKQQNTNQILFALLRSAICGTQLTTEERNGCDQELLNDLLRLAKKHDIAHLAVLGLKKNGLLTGQNASLETGLLHAAFRYERINYEYEKVCQAFEEIGIAYIPLKGSVLRALYPEVWMRTSCDIDILVHSEDLDKAVSYLAKKMNYVMKIRTTHDVVLDSPSGVHLELHYDLVEEGRANNAIGVLSTVWEDVSLRKGSGYFYQMSDAFFYFYHIAHMAKHFETGGCGIRPFIDLWLLDHMDGADIAARDTLLEKGGLLQFTNVCRKLSCVWLGGEEADAVSLQMQAFLLHGGVYGSTDNRVVLQQKKQGGRWGYLWSRIFVPREKLGRYYPILKKHRWLLPFMQVRRWFMLLRPEVAGMAKRELEINKSVEVSKADTMNAFLEDIGLQG